MVTLCGIMMIIRNIIFNRKHVQGFSKRYYIQSRKTERKHSQGVLLLFDLYELYINQVKEGVLKE